MRPHDFNALAEHAECECPPTRLYAVDRRALARSVHRLLAPAARFEAGAKVSVVRGRFRVLTRCSKCGGIFILNTSDKRRRRCLACSAKGRKRRAKQVGCTPSAYLAASRG